MLKVLIADDEKLARETIKCLLNGLPDIGEIFEADNGNKVLALVKMHQPDIIFLDIQMPGKLGTDVATEIPVHTAVIFATAYDQYAVSAFELCAIDYLLKPFDDQRFYQALAKAKQKLSRQTTTDFQQVTQLLQQIKTEQESPFQTRIIVKDAGRIRFIDVDAINYIEGAGNYADIQLNDGSHILHRETLTSLERKLDPNHFIRIHRSTIVKHNNITELRSTESGDYLVQMKSGQQLTLSRRNKDKLKQLLDEHR